MTIERKIIVGIDDIKGVCFECLECKARTTVSPDKIGNIPATCSRCNATWIAFRPDAQQETLASPFVNLTSAIEIIRVLHKQGATQGFTILFEFDEPR